MLVFMVKGLFSRLDFPYAQFPCTAVSGDQLFKPFWEAVCRLERCGFKVLGLTADGLSANRRLFKLHQPGTQLVYKVPNPYATDDRDLFFFSDPPHLLKTTRNCWASKNRHLWVCCIIASVFNMIITTLLCSAMDRKLPGLISCNSTRGIGHRKVLLG